MKEIFGNVAAIPSRGLDLRSRGLQLHPSVAPPLFRAGGWQGAPIPGLVLHGGPRPSCCANPPTPKVPQGLLEAWLRVLPYSSSFHNYPPSPYDPPYPSLPLTALQDLRWPPGGMEGEVLGCFIITKCRCQGGLACSTPPAHQAASGEECLTP